MSKHAKHSKETLGFTGFSGYYASLPAQYGGFYWIDVNYMNATYWQNVATNWCDTGYQSAIRGASEAFTWGPAIDAPSKSGFVTSNSSETFTLTSMVAASAWETHQAFDFRSYIYTNGGLVLKASDTVFLSQTAKTINFARMPGGKSTDFKNIAEVYIIPARGKYGNTCTYGRYGYTTGYQMAFDNLKVTWNGSIPRGHNGGLTTKHSLYQLHHHAGRVAAHLSGDVNHQSAADGHSPAPVHHADGTGYHTELLSLWGDSPSGLTGQFVLPHIEHFGT